MKPVYSNYANKYKNSTVIFGGLGIMSYLCTRN